VVPAGSQSARWLRMAAFAMYRLVYTIYPSMSSKFSCRQNALSHVQYGGRDVQVKQEIP